MTLIDDWKLVLLKARSVRWAAVSGLLSLVECGVPFLNGMIPSGYFAMAAMLAAFAVPFARVTLQKELSDG